MENYLKIEQKLGFDKIKEYILNNFDKDISLPEMAAMANMAVTTFCNFFKEQYRITFVEYLNSVRIGHACKLLSVNDQNIVDVAFECGMADQLGKKLFAWMEDGRTKKFPPSFSAAWSMNSGIWTAAAPFSPPATVATHIGDSGTSMNSADPIISAIISDMFRRVGGWCSA